jgi:hypothetical protein
MTKDGGRDSFELIGSIEFFFEVEGKRAQKDEIVRSAGPTIYSVLQNPKPGGSQSQQEAERREYRKVTGPVVGAFPTDFFPPKEIWNSEKKVPSRPYHDGRTCRGCPLV